MALVNKAKLDEMLPAVDAELSDPRRRGRTFTVVQIWATIKR